MADYVCVKMLRQSSKDCRLFILPRSPKINTNTQISQPQDIANLAHGLSRLRALCGSSDEGVEDESSSSSHGASPSFLRGLQARALIAFVYPSHLPYPIYILTHDQIPQPTQTPHRRPPSASAAPRSSPRSSP